MGVGWRLLAEVCFSVRAADEGGRFRFGDGALTYHQMCIGGFLWCGGSDGQRNQAGIDENELPLFASHVTSKLWRSPWLSRPFADPV